MMCARKRTRYELRKCRTIVIADCVVGPFDKRPFNCGSEILDRGQYDIEASIAAFASITREKGDGLFDL